MKIIIRWRPLALFGIALLGLALRLYGINWDQGNSFHPDERQIMFHVMALAWPKSLSQLLDPVNSPLNPHFFAYGTFPMYLLAIVGNIITHVYPAIDSLPNLTLVGRVLSALFDTGTILLTACLALRLANDTTPGRPRAWNLALLSAALVAFTPFEIQQAHYFTVDDILLFFIVLTVLSCVALVDTEKVIRWSLLAGLGFGLALATKFSAAPLAVPLIVALLLRWYRHDFSSSLLSLLVTACATLASFLIAMPYALLDYSNFVSQVTYQGDLARGLIDLPYVRQFAGTTPYVYELHDLVLWGLGLMLGIAALAGLLWFLWRIWKRTAGPWMILVAWVIVYFAVVGSFYVKYMRYTLPIYPFLVLMGAALLLVLLQFVKDRGYKNIVIRALPYAAIVLVLAGTIFQGLALLNVYSVTSTRIQASEWIYQHIKPGSVLTYEQWDDPLPFPVGNNSPYIYPQATYKDSSGQTQTGLDLYDDDTVQKAQTIASMLAQTDLITMATDRLDKSIPRLPARYPLTIHYYQLLFSGQLGFHLAAEFSDRPNLFGIVLNDSGADESYSVFDHPTVKLFERDNPFPYTAQQLYQKLMAGVQLPAPGAGLSGAQKPLLLSSQQIAQDQQSPSFSVQFPPDSVTNKLPILFWWLLLLALGLCAYPIVFLAFYGFRDRGYIFAKTVGVLLFAFFGWMLASLHILPFSFLSLLLVLIAMILAALAVVFWQRQALRQFVREHWRLLLIEEGIFTLAFLLFVGIRALNPDAWNPYIGGEKPMELAFLNAVLRSPYMPPLDPWFSGGYINYYYYGYIIFGSLIKITGIAPTTAFNLAMPTLFALTFTGAVTIVYTLGRSFPLALLGGYFAAMIGNLDGVGQLKGQLVALISRAPVPGYNYWQSSRVIVNTINEFPYWSFLFADLHPHVIDMPIEILMLGVTAMLLLARTNKELAVNTYRKERWILYALAAFTFGSIAVINPWDIPVYALLLAAVMLVGTIYRKRQEPPLELCISLGYTIVGIALICGLGYLCYWPFYQWYQELFINGVGIVGQGSTLGSWLTVFGFWLFVALSFLLVELYFWWGSTRRFRANPMPEARRAAGYVLVACLALVFLALIGLKLLLFALVVVGIFLFVQHFIVPRYFYNFDPTLCFSYLLLLMGLCIVFGIEVVYIRDFLDGSAYERMNTVFKFSMPAWLCFGVGSALVLPHLWRSLRGFLRRAWSVALVALVLGCTIFLVEGTAARIGDHQLWAEVQPPAVSANYTPTLDGFAFARSWYPGDAAAITWLNDHVSGSPVILEGVAPQSYQWYNRVSVYTGLPDVVGWPDHEEEQRYPDQVLSRVNDANTIFTTPDKAQALQLLHLYNVRYIYVGALEQQLYSSAPGGLAKFQQMVGSSLRIVYNTGGVTIYEVL
jgi:YYY domain-containing protein